MAKYIRVWDNVFKELNTERTNRGITWNDFLRSMFRSWNNERNEFKVFKSIVRSELEEIKNRISELELKVLELEQK